jgi:hypothetical protein
MERFKRAMKLAAMMLSLCFVFALSVTAQAATGDYVNGTTYVNPSINGNGEQQSVTKIRMASYSEDSIQVVFPAGGTVAVSSNKKALEAAVTYVNNEEDYDAFDVKDANGLVTQQGYIGKATISLRAGKPGNYKLTVTVNGVPTVVKVYVTKFGGSVVTKATLGKKQLTKSTKSGTDKKASTTYKSNYKVSGSTKSGKLKISSDKGIKVTGVVYSYIDKKGKAVYKKGKTIKLSQEYAKNARSDVFGSKSRSARKLTYVYVSYKDKYLGTSVKYSVTKKHGVKQIKAVRTAFDGTKYISYIDYNAWTEKVVDEDTEVESYVQHDATEYDDVYDYYYQDSTFTIWAY